VAKFERGGPGGPGRPRGVKDKLAVTFLEALQKDFEEGGGRQSGSHASKTLFATPQSSHR
jgi:hypothetical protein